MTGAIAAAADGVLMPEQGRSEETIVAAVAKLVRAGFERGKRRVLVIKAEGVEIPCTRLVRLVEAEVGAGIDVRATVLGHLVRGGAASYFDRMLASRLSLAAMEAILDDKTPIEGGEMVAWPTSGAARRRAIRTCVVSRSIRCWPRPRRSSTAPAW